LNEQGTSVGETGSTQDVPSLTLPDYRGGSLVNLMSSITTALGGTSPYPPLAVLPPQALAGARHVLLLVIDGLGLDYLSSHDGALRRHLHGQLTSVFPSTTASAIPTFLTGLAPQQHGLTGWNMYFREIGAVVAPLPFRVRTGRHALREAGVTPASLFGLTPLFDRLPLPCHVVSPRSIIHSDFNVALSGRAKRHGYETLDELFALIKGLLSIDTPPCLLAAARQPGPRARHPERTRGRRLFLAGRGFRQAAGGGGPQRKLHDRHCRPRLHRQPGRPDHRSG